MKGETDIFTGLLSSGSFNLSSIITVQVHIKTLSMKLTRSVESSRLYTLSSSGDTLVIPETTLT